MAKVLLIRDLTPEAAAALDLYREQAGMKSNTDAAMAMMEKYHQLIHDLKNMNDMYWEVFNKLDRIKKAYQRHVTAQDDFQRIIQDKETKSEQDFRQRIQDISLTKRIMSVRNIVQVDQEEE